MNAIPVKSSIRSPNKLKGKSVWFKKQKYHCVYEYPREPETPPAMELWQTITDFTDFYLSSGSGSFQQDLSSEFFPGQQQLLWTPDSGVEDVVTPPDGDFHPLTRKVETLKTLASMVLSRKESLGELRHTRDKLKLDLPIVDGKQFILLFPVFLLQAAVFC